MIDFNYIDKIESYVNSFPSGYLKRYKIFSIVSAINDGKICDQHRLFCFLETCLLMEGFSAQSTLEITNFLLKMIKEN